MEPEGSLPQSQASATCPYPDPARSSPYSHILLDEVLTSLKFSCLKTPATGRKKKKKEEEEEEEEEKKKKKVIFINREFSVRAFRCH